MTIIAVPSNNEEGINSSVSSHFGHCEYYTLVTLEDNQVKEIKNIKNNHDEGGCIGSVNSLKNNNVNVLIAGGMGKRPFEFCNQAGIEIYQNVSCSNVEEVLNAYKDGKLSKFGTQALCAGGQHHHMHKHEHKHGCC